MEHTISVRLCHFCVNVVATVAQFGDFFRQQFDTLRWIAEYDRLIDLQFREQCVQTMDLLALLHECIVLCDTFERELFHQIDFIWITQMFVHKIFHAERECGRKQKNLQFFWQFHDYMIQHAFEILWQKFIGFVEYEHSALRHICNFFVDEIKNTAGRCDNKLNWMREPNGGKKSKYKN